MDSKIKVKIFGIGNEALPSGCCCSGKKNNGCSGCRNRKNSCNSCNNEVNNSCSNHIIKTLNDAYNDLESFINVSDIKDNTELEFIDLDKIDIKDEEYGRVKDIIDKGFNPPITVIDNIIRYYAGISNTLIYKDVKELLE